MPTNSEAPDTAVSDAGNPGQQVTSPAPSAQAQTVNWEDRYKGQVPVIEQLTLKARQLEAELAQKSSEMEQLRTQLGTKETEREVVAREKDSFIKTATEEKIALEKELQRLRSLELKVKTANELGRPDVLAVVDTIPGVEDPETMKTIMERITNYADLQVKAREAQLMSGLTPGPERQSAPAGPSTADGWVRHIEGLPLGSPERAQAMKDYGTFLKAANK